MKTETRDKALWEELELRVVTFQVAAKGFRTKQVTVVTTLLDEERYPDEAIAQLSGRRWSVELFFREIKTTLGWMCCVVSRLS
jgi:IS4 transposase